VIGAQYPLLPLQGLVVKVARGDVFP
jgi:hypothetical protein